MNSDETVIYESTCSRCDTVFPRPAGREKRLCHKCVIAVQIEAHDQMHNKQGPVYEKAVRQQLAYWSGEAKRLKLRG